MSSSENLASVVDNTFIYCYSSSEPKQMTLPENTKIKSITATSTTTIILTENDEYILMEIIDENNVTGLYIKDNLKIFATCPLSQRFIAINKNNKFKCWQIKIVKQKRCIKSKIKNIYSNHFTTLIHTMDNELYVSGTNANGQLDCINNDDSDFDLQYLTFTKKNFNKKVKLVGFFSTFHLILTEVTNNKVDNNDNKEKLYGCGDNSFGGLDVFFLCE
ncbi:hypothetical protein ABK040_012774 [Willaertia magna]